MKTSIAFAGLFAVAKAAVQYDAPASGGGSMLATVIGSDGLGEPINVVVSGESDAAVLTSSGFLAFMQSIDFSGECLGFSEPASLAANLGDGNGLRNATATLRYNFGDPSSGTCNETVHGGNHLRYWQQTGSSADSSAYFLAVSVEQNLTQGHNILPGGPGANGYDLGRDWLAGNATAGITSASGYQFTTTASQVSGLLSAGSSGVNHGLSLDGKVTVLTVKAASAPSSASASASSSAQPASPSDNNKTSSPATATFARLESVAAAVLVVVLGSLAL